MNKYEKPIAIMFNVLPTDIITTSSTPDDNYEPGVELPEVEFPRDLNINN